MAQLIQNADEKEIIYEGQESCCRTGLPHAFLAGGLQRA
jgi:hypothetical protein